MQYEPDEPEAQDAEGDAKGCTIFFCVLSNLTFRIQIFEN